MAFQTALTIKETIANIHSKKYLLPSIQREFVWDVDQITQLFDSLMLGYPIGSFLFWEVSPANVKEFVFLNFFGIITNRKRMAGTIRKQVLSATRPSLLFLMASNA
jgi:hypothetical protein